MFERKMFVSCAGAFIGLAIATAGVQADVIQFQAGAHPTGAYDSPGGMISLDAPTTIYGGWQQAYLGYDYRSSHREWRVLYSFDVSAIPDGAQIDSASYSFSIYAGTSSTASTLTLGLHPLTGSFNEGQATWNNRDSTTPWTTPGGDFGSELASVTLNDPDSLNGLSSPITIASTPALAAAIQSASDNNTAFNFILAADIPNGATDRGLLFTASNNVDVNSVPYHGVPPVLTINYTVPEPATLSLMGMLGLGLLMRRRG